MLGRGTQALSIALVLVACGGNEPGRPAVDAGRTDGGGGTTDGGPPVDGGRVDTGMMMGRMCGRQAGMCDVIAQDCGAGMACVYGTTMMGGMASTICIAAGVRALGETCGAAEGQCQAGLFCSASTNICTEYCCEGSVADCSQAGALCFGGGAEAPWLGVCNVPAGCTLVPQSGCGAGEACYPVSADGTTDCLTAGTTPVGMTCDSANACVPGAICAGMGGMFTCQRTCRMGMDADCMGMGMCTGGLMGISGVGLCQGG